MAREHEFEVGDLVVERDDPWIQVVVGHTPDGRCRTEYLFPPPWLTESESHLILEYPEGHLVPAGPEHLPRTANAS